MTIYFYLTQILFIIAFFSFDNKCDQTLQEKINSENKFLTGNGILLDKNSDLISAKRIGLIVNSSSVLSNGVFFLDKLSSDFNVTKIFTPEHGLRIDDNNEDYIDGPTGLPVISLYGSKKKPDVSDLDNTDVLVYDIQDVGARFYTFINTMYYCMEAAAENNKEFIVCDRPLMPYGNYVDGFMLDESEVSFVGLIDIPVAYGMTCGELASYINGEYFSGKCKLTVIKMENYTRETDYENLNLPWIKPSPNMYFPSSAFCYLGTCLFEGTNFAEGRGTDKPFEYVGAPYCDNEILVNELNLLKLNGVSFERISFTPQSISSNSNPPKFIGELCNGVFINVTDKKTFEPVKTGIAILYSVNKLFEGFQINKNNFLDKLSGTKDLRIMLNNGSSYEVIISSYSERLNRFKSIRENYLIYK